MKIVMKKKFHPSSKELRYLPSWKKKSVLIHLHGSGCEKADISSQGIQLTTIGKKEKRGISRRASRKGRLKEGKACPQLHGGATEESFPARLTKESSGQ